MTTLTMKKSRGFTLIEALIAIVIIGVLGGIVATKISGFTQGQALNNGLDDVMAIINEARSQTEAAVSNGTVYGVHLQSDKAILFQGGTYTVGASTNKPVVLNSTIIISSITLNGGGADVIFSKNGETSDYGTFIVKRSSTTTGQKTVTVTKTGLVSSN